MLGRFARTVCYDVNVDDSLTLFLCSLTSKFSLTTLNFRSPLTFWKKTEWHHFLCFMCLIVFFRSTSSSVSNSNSASRSSSIAVPVAIAVPVVAVVRVVVRVLGRGGGGGGRNSNGGRGGGSGGRSGGRSGGGGGGGITSDTMATAAAPALTLSLICRC